MSSESGSSESPGLGDRIGKKSPLVDIYPVSYVSANNENTETLYRVDYEVNEKHFSNQSPKIVLDNIGMNGYFYVSILKGSNILDIFDMDHEHLRWTYIHIRYRCIWNELLLIMKNYSPVEATKFIGRYIIHVGDPSLMTKSDFLDFLASSKYVKAGIRISGIIEAPQCWGCRHNAPGQKSHMAPNGCLYTIEIIND